MLARSATISLGFQLALYAIQVCVFCVLFLTIAFSSGFYAQFPASSACDACQPGTFGLSAGQAICATVPAGVCVLVCVSVYVSYSDTMIVCHAGFYTNTTAAPIPIACPAGSFAGDKGLTSCVLCQPGMHDTTTLTLNHCVTHNRHVLWISWLDRVLNVQCSSRSKRIRITNVCSVSFVCGFYEWAEMSMLTWYLCLCAAVANKLSILHRFIPGHN